MVSVMVKSEYQQLQVYLRDQLKPYKSLFAGDGIRHKVFPQYLPVYSRFNVSHDIQCPKMWELGGRTVPFFLNYPVITHCHSPSKSEFETWGRYDPPTTWVVNTGADHSFNIRVIDDIVTSGIVPMLKTVRTEKDVFEFIIGNPGSLLLGNQVREHFMAMWNEHFFEPDA